MSYKLKKNNPVFGPPCIIHCLNKMQYEYMDMNIHWVDTGVKNTSSIWQIY